MPKGKKKLSKQLLEKYPDLKDYYKLNGRLNNKAKEKIFKIISEEEKEEFMEVFNSKNLKISKENSIDKVNMSDTPIEVNCVETEDETGTNIYGDVFQKCQQIANDFEKNDVGEYYTSIMCLKGVGGLAPARDSTLKTHYDKISSHISNSIDEIKSHQQKRICVLPKGHLGMCNCKMNIFKINETTSKIIGKVEQSIYSTPGADDYVIKNRDSRLHPIALTKYQEKKIKDKKIKLSCAIHLKEKSTPFYLSTAYIDYLVYIINISDISEYIDQSSPHYHLCIDMLTKHKEYLIDNYKQFNRKVFDSDGHTICAVLGITLKVIDLADSDRDNRTDIRPTDIQMGHISSRCEDCYTIYGTNIVMMTRRGNLIIGEHSFIEDIWINELKNICRFHCP